MSNTGPFELLGLSASGLGAERARVAVITKNIANANVTRSEDGGPYRRQAVAFETVLRRTRGEDIPAGGVRIGEVSEDDGEFRKVLNPAHPDADAEGFVRMPNVDIHTEMVDLLNSSQSYEANLAAMRMYRDMMQQTMAINR